MSQKKHTVISDCVRIPPQAVDIEESILGALLNDSEAIFRINLSPDDFYKDAHAKIFKAIRDLSDSSKVDMFTVTEKLQKNGQLDDVGGAYYITKLTTENYSSSHIETHACIIREKSIARKLINMGSSIQEMAFSPETDVFEVLEYAESKFTDLSTETGEADVSDMQQSLSETIKYIQDIHNLKQSGKLTGIPTGLTDLNRELNGGWHAPDLIVLGGRPGMGKTQFAVHFAQWASKFNQETLFVSIEMTKIQLILRMITESDALDIHKIRTGQMTPEEWSALDQIMGKLANMSLFIADDHSIRNLNNIKSLARKMSRQGKLKLLIIDYLQLIKTNMKFGTRDLEIGYITGELKNLAKELSIPIILLAQLNRPQKGMKITSPKLEDLRESGNIEQDADIVCFIHRPTYYDPNAPNDSFGRSWENRGGLILAKNREGQKDKKITFLHDAKYKRIWDDNSHPSINDNRAIRQNITPDVNGWVPTQDEDEDTPF